MKKKKLDSGPPQARRVLIHVSEERIRISAPQRLNLNYRKRRRRLSMRSSMGKYSNGYVGVVVIKTCFIHNGIDETSFDANHC
jgi:hypothetical protein